MKKTYICPLIMVHHIEVAQMLAASDTGLRTGSTEADASEGLVKGNISSGYNVWDDDWSK